MGVREWLERWPVYRQVTGADRLGRGAAAASRATRQLVKSSFRSWTQRAESFLTQRYERGPVGAWSASPTRRDC